MIARHLSKVNHVGEITRQEWVKSPTIILFEYSLDSPRSILLPDAAESRRIGLISRPPPLTVERGHINKRGAGEAQDPRPGNNGKCSTVSCPPL